MRSAVPRRLDGRALGRLQSRARPDVEEGATGDALPARLVKVADLAVGPLKRRLDLESADLAGGGHGLVFRRGNVSALA